MRKLVILLLTCSFGSFLLAQKESKDVREGNKLYQSSKYTEAEVAYRKGLVKNPKSLVASYNLGNALFRQKKYQEALEQYSKLGTRDKADKKKLAAAMHNAGNALFQEKKYEESIKAYKAALKYNPHDDETRYNLAYAQMMLKNEKNKNKNKDNKKDQNQPQPQPQPQPQQSQSQPKPQMSKDNAQQILDALMQDEKNTQEKARKQPARGAKKAERDW